MSRILLILVAVAAFAPALEAQHDPDAPAGRYFVGSSAFVVANPGGDGRGAPPGRAHFALERRQGALNEQNLQLLVVESEDDAVDGEGSSRILVAVRNGLGVSITPTLVLHQHIKERITLGHHGELNMKALIYDRYGGPEVLRLSELDRPQPAPDEVVVQVEAVTLNLSDWEILTGRPLYARIYGFLSPRRRILGSDIAGRVLEVGSRVHGLRPGDAVYGDTMGSFGGFSEFAQLPARTLHPFPPGLSYEQAAALPQAALIALQGLRAGRGVTRGSSVLINGGGGGTGLFAIQLAKLWGATVTAVDNADKLAHMRRLGADRVLDYRATDFTQTGDRYDHVLDLVGTRSLRAQRRALRPGGQYLVVGGKMSSMLQSAILGPIWGKLTGVRMGVLAVEPNRRSDLDEMAELVRSGAIQLVIDQRFPLEEVPEALRYLGEGRACGKMVIQVGSRAGESP